MPDTKSGIRAFLGRKSVLALNFAVALLVGYGFVGEYLNSREVQAEIGRLEKEVGVLEARNTELARMSDRLSGSGMLEREARLKLNLKRPGEEVVVIRDADETGLAVSDAEAVAETARSDRDEAQSNVRKWLMLLLPSVFD